MYTDVCMGPCKCFCDPRRCLEDCPYFDLRGVFPQQKTIRTYLRFFIQEVQCFIRNELIGSSSFIHVYVSAPCVNALIIKYIIIEGAPLRS